MILSGLARLGRDCEVRYLQDGTAVANLSLAFNYGKKGPDGKRPTTWVSASLWGKLAEALAEYLTKGTQVCVVLSEVHLEEFKRADDSKGVALKARVDSLELAGSKREQEPERAEPAAKEAAPATGGAFADDFKDDIPFS